VQNPNPSATVYSGPLWFVRSDSNPDRFYAVGVDPRTALYVCECPDHVNRRRDCKHVQRVQAGTVQPATRKAPTPAAAPVSIPVRQPRRRAA
jgi:hypothetical protein